MAEGKKKGRLYADLVSSLIMPAALMAAVIAASAVTGGGTAYYALYPLSFTASFFMLFYWGESAVCEHQIHLRLYRRHFADAISFFQSASVDGWLIALFCLIYMVLGGRFSADFLFGTADSYLILYALTPAFVLLPQIGVMTGLLRSVGWRTAANIGAGIGGCICAPASLLFCIALHHYGEGASLLLQNNTYQYIYAAAGLCLGISAGVFISFLFLLFMSHLARRGIIQQQDRLRIDNDERLKDLLGYAMRKLLPYVIPSVIPSALMILGGRIGNMAASQDGTPRFSVNAFCGFAAFATPIVVLCACLLVILLSGVFRGLLTEVVRQREGALRMRFDILMNMLLFVCVPSSFFIFSAAKPLLVIVRSRCLPSVFTGAVISLKTSSLLLTAIPLAFFMTALAVKTGMFRGIAVAGAVGIFVNCFFDYMLTNLAGLGITVIGPSMTAALLVYALLLHSIMKRSVLRRTELLYPQGDLRILISAAVAAVPTILGNDFVTDELIPIGGFVVSAIIYWVIYLVLVILLGGVDLENVHRIPFGALVLRLAGAMHVRVGEDYK